MVEHAQPVGRTMTTTQRARRFVLKRAIGRVLEYPDKHRGDIVFSHGDLVEFTDDVIDATERRVRREFAKEARVALRAKADAIQATSKELPCRVAMGLRGACIVLDRLTRTAGARRRRG